ncbi:MFS transporter [Bdellovibrio sp. KM01]|uniref:MFS transporter n=1 Tax=Bdellovibrio sp. KM01 TaxID=2748865 RepID=UPI0015E945F4|nr:MFS transporter [Bdellovibrio sp. KM01]QLY26580.1 MFS transporter [Bdellovibrio sp. KM01]
MIQSSSSPSALTPAIPGATSKSFLALAMGGFGIGMTEFVIMGLLPNVAHHLNITIPEAGHVISSYALGVVVGAPLLTVLGAKYSAKNLLLFLMALFTLFNGVSALATDYYSLMLFRFMAGLPHGAYFGVGAVVASRLAKPGKEASAVASMLTGLTIANVVGVPLGTYVGVRFGWQWAFVMVAVVGLATTMALKSWIPAIPKNPTASFKSEFKIFRNFNLWICIVITAIGFGGFFAWISYIAPLLTDVTKVSPEMIPLWMVLAGVGMTAGIIFGGKLADRFSALKAAIALMTAMMLMLILSSLLAEYQVATFVMVFLTGMFAMAQCPPVQMLLIQNSQGGEMLGSSLGQACFNVGNSLGAFLGGLPLVIGYSYAAPTLVGAMMSLVGIVFAFILMKRVSGWFWVR